MTADHSTVPLGDGERMHLTLDAILLCTATSAYFDFTGSQRMPGPGPYRTLGCTVHCTRTCTA